MTISAFLLGCIAVFSFLCIVVVLFFERTSPASSLVWILVLVFLPVIGFVFYLFLGSGFRLSKQKRYLFKAARDNLYNNYIVKRLNFSHSRIFTDEEQGAERVANYLRGQADGPVTDDNTVEIFTDGNDMFPRLFEDVRKAKHHVHVLFYIFRNDNIGKEFLAILTEKARQGVEIRLIYAASAP
ncbi:MAG: PLDc N-terminal domain-containing protein [Planctomycetes bacterium]|nr:PLDc N-terminal domain-containing protein [Planctomycetota bacterium]